ncbi:outer membrane protein assembly factor BamB family protein [Anatilimnocola floriformis]|uniref:outer membrane protein assembly factor BamB family protein n=1 Tax=Anatilimnocola floriformis TaxID=2948575 RepID=UPI0020C1BF34|nr:PQQ-binding-like beta-propeller repeat protein [Anatilimnocola floriformis]
MRRLLLVLVFAWTFSAAAAAGENWPGWRGPRGDGTSLEENVPTHWNATTGENIAWQTPIPGIGHAQPVIWGDRIFLVACVNDTKERVVLCLDRTSGKILWQKTVFTAPLESKHALNSFASSTPVTDGKLVFVSFLEVDGSTVPAPNVGGAPRPITPGKMVVAAYDFEGNQKWIERPGEFVSAHGFCSSPVLFENNVIVNGDHDGKSYIVALEQETGKVAWKQPRANGIRSYVTPLIREIDGRTQMILSGSKHIISLNPRDGTEHWKIEGPTEQFVASMVFDGKLLFMAAGFPTYHVMGIRPDGRGNVTETHVAWHATNAKCYVPSPVVVGDYLMVADDRGTANCFLTADGERLWQERLGKGFNNSLVTANGLAYLLADDGLTKVIKPGEKLDVVAENPCGERCFASLAISQGQIFLRGEKHLFCIGKK